MYSLYLRDDTSVQIFPIYWNPKCCPLAKQQSIRTPIRFVEYLVYRKKFLFQPIYYSRKLHNSRGCSKSLIIIICSYAQMDLYSFSIFSVLDEIAITIPNVPQEYSQNILGIFNRCPAGYSQNVHQKYSQDIPLNKSYQPPPLLGFTVTPKTPSSSRGYPHSPITFVKREG